MSGFHPKDLIKEVKCRPGLYNKDLLEHPRREHKHQLWLEVGEKLTPKDDWKCYSDIEKDARGRLDRLKHVHFIEKQLH